MSYQLHWPQSRTGSGLTAPGMTEVRKADLTACRWWTVEEPEATTDELVPRDLAAQLRALLVSGPPASPVDVGV